MTQILVENVNVVASVLARRRTSPAALSSQSVIDLESKEGSNTRRYRVVCL